MAMATGHCVAMPMASISRPQVARVSSSSFMRGASAIRSRPVAPLRLAMRSLSITAAAAPTTERLRLNNLSPQDGARRKNKRKGRGYGAGQGGTCGFGMRGQKARSGSGTRPGFEGGQTSLYRRLPKLKGICGGMSAGVQDFVTINLDTLAGAFDADDSVTIAALQAKRILNLSGREARLPLKILGDGELPFALTVHAESISEGARAKIEAAGGKFVAVAVKPKWTRKLHNRRIREAAALAAKK